jgi:hypothetical protein
METRVKRREVIKGIVVGMGALGMGGIVTGEETSKQPPKPMERDEIKFWLETALKRVFPNSPAGSAGLLELHAGCNERISFQACFRNEKTSSIRVRASVEGADGWKPVVRRVGFVPLQQLNTDVPEDEMDGIGFVPGLVPDPLYPEETAHVGPEANGVFWISLTTAENAQPGIRKVIVRLTVEDEFSFPGWKGVEPWSVELPVRIQVYPLVVQPRKDFPVTHWLNVESIWDYYKIEPFGERFWELAEAYVADLTAHGVDVIYSPIFNNRHEIIPRPAQLLKVRRTGEDAYEFDFADVRRWIRMALEHGASHVEWTHLFTPAPTSGKHPQRIFERWDKMGEMLWPPEISATSNTYRRFLEQFLPQFKQVLEEEKVLDRSLFHCADEPDGDIQMADYRKARGLLRNLAPWMKVMDAMSDPRFATERLTDMPVPSIVTAPLFTKAGCPAWTYFCCGPRGRFLQRLHDTPLPKLRMAGWLFYKLGAKGFLHWGHNYWYVFCTGTMGDPFNDPANGAWPGLPYGDSGVVYPGPNGPISSIRWEVFSESLQDYALLQSAGAKPDDPMLASLKSYEVFPKSEDWLAEARKKILMKKAGAK